MNKHCNHFIQILKSAYKRKSNNIIRYLKYKTLKKRCNKSLVLNKRFL